MTKIFHYQNRFAAGHQLAKVLRPYIKSNALVLALPHGGVPVATTIAQDLNIPMDILLVRKLGFAIGAITSGGIQVFNPNLTWQISQDTLNAIVEPEKAELRRREETYRGYRPPVQLAQKQIILVDEGLTAATDMRYSIDAVKQAGATEIIVAVPVATAQIVKELRLDVTKMVCPMAPGLFMDIGQWYDDFPQLSEHDVHTLLKQTWQTETTLALV